jgi:DNA-binding NtrC family response regulator
MISWKGRESTKPLKILIVDDELLIRWSLTEALSQEGHEVMAVENATKAIDATQRYFFDYIITDLVMPEIDGWTVLEFARQNQPTSRVILITAYGAEDTKKIAQERGAWAYIEKPYLIDEIKRIIKQGPQRPQNHNN